MVSHDGQSWHDIEAGPGPLAFLTSLTLGGNPQSPIKPGAGRDDDVSNVRTLAESRRTTDVAGAAVCSQ